MNLTYENKPRLKIFSNGFMLWKPGANWTLNKKLSIYVYLNNKSLQGFD